MILLQTVCKTTTVQPYMDKAGTGIKGFLKVLANGKRVRWPSLITSLPPKKIAVAWAVANGFAVAKLHFLPLGLKHTALGTSDSPERKEAAMKLGRQPAPTPLVRTTLPV